MCIQNQVKRVRYTAVKTTSFPGAICSSLLHVSHAQLKLQHFKSWWKKWTGKKTVFKTLHSNRRGGASWTSWQSGSDFKLNPTTWSESDVHCVKKSDLASKIFDIFRQTDRRVCLLIWLFIRPDLCRNPDQDLNVNKNSSVLIIWVKYIYGFS